MCYMFKNILCCLLLAATFTSCKKGEQIETWKKMTEVNFDASRVALRNNGEGIYIAARYNGEPVEWNASVGNIKVVEGEGVFSFYDTRTGATVAEKTVNVKADSAQGFTMFQPTLSSPVTFIDPKAQDQEPTPEAGSMKIKLSNYAQELIPFNKVDVKITIIYYDQDFNEVHEELGIIRNISKTASEGEYVTLPNGITETAQLYGYMYSLEFIDGDTGAPLLNHGGTTYQCVAYSLMFLDPPPQKHIYTLYLSTEKAWGEAPAFIKNGEDFYNVTCNLLFYN